MYTSYDNIGLLKVLKFLKSHKDDFLSGQDLSDVLKISRVAVWKHIKTIKSLGYKIESKQKLGYRLVKNSEKLLPWEITDNLKTKTIGRKVYYFDIIDSTQNFAMEIATKKNENGSIVIAQKQTSGRGRMNRKWVTGKGGVSLSIILHPKFDVSISTLFPIAASVALVNAIQNTLKINPNVKWPNDIVIKGKKVAGMIVDSTIESNLIENMILGVGINFKVDTKNLESKLKDTENFYGVSSLLKTTNNITALELVQNFLFELEKVITLLNNGKTSQIIQRWEKSSTTIGKRVSIKTNDGIVTGIAKKINNDGSLNIIKNGKIQKVIAGDVSI
tara:strand:+ start:391 stop:1386 length:996 start_codon:yes stop_codon:yes gene_type:complete